MGFEGESAKSVPVRDSRSRLAEVAAPCLLPLMSSRLTSHLFLRRLSRLDPEHRLLLATSGPPSSSLSRALSPH